MIGSLAVCISIRGPLDYFSLLHDYPVVVALAAIGAISIGVLVPIVALRGFGDIAEEYYNLLHRLDGVRRRRRRPRRKNDSDSS